MSDSPTKLGTLLDETAQRDAVHVAVAPVIVCERLMAGDHVGILERLAEGDVVSTKASPWIGIIDPFLLTRLDIGARCWLFLYPNTITSLRHQWTHPAFDEPPDMTLDEALDKVRATAAERLAWVKRSPPSIDEKQLSHNWIKAFLAGLGCEHVYEAVVKSVVSKDFDEKYLNVHGFSIYGEIPPEFWFHVSNITGKPNDGPLPKAFNCIC